MMAFPRGLHAVHCVHPPLPESPSPSKRSPTPPACSPPRPSSPPKNQFLMQLFRDSNPEPIILTVNIDRSEKEPMAYRGGFKDIRTGTCSLCCEFFPATSNTLMRGWWALDTCRFIFRAMVFSKVVFTWEFLDVNIGHAV